MFSKFVNVECWGVLDFCRVIERFVFIGFCFLCRDNCMKVFFYFYSFLCDFIFGLFFVCFIGDCWLDFFRTKFLEFYLFFFSVD